MGKLLCLAGSKSRDFEIMAVPRIILAPVSIKLIRRFTRNCGRGFLQSSNFLVPATGGGGSVAACECHDVDVQLLALVSIFFSQFGRIFNACVVSPNARSVAFLSSAGP